VDIGRVQRLQTQEVLAEAVHITISQELLAQQARAMLEEQRQVLKAGVEAGERGELVLTLQVVSAVMGA